MQMDGVAVRVDLPEKTMTFGIGEFNIGATPRTSVCRCQHSRNSVITILKRKAMACTLAFVSLSRLAGRWSAEAYQLGALLLLALHRQAI